MSTYTVVSASKKKDIPDGKYGPMQVIALQLRGETATAAQIAALGAEWYTKATTPLPAEGSTIEGDLEQTEYGWKFKKAQVGSFNNNAPRPEDPKRAARIMRQHSQEMALRYAAIRHAQGKLPDTFSLEDLFKIADRFDADGAGAAS